MAQRRQHNSSVRITDLQWPMGGFNERNAYSKPPNYTTPDCLNVRPDAILEDRTRGGTRPGLEKAFALQLGDGTPVQMLSQITFAEII